MIRKATIFVLTIYRMFLSPFLGNNCRFYPSCSLYARIAIERFGVWCGGLLILQRLLKCHPWYNGNGYDPVPDVLPARKRVFGLIKKTGT
jgi:hypothetical protein